MRSLLLGLMTALLLAAPVRADELVVKKSNHSVAVTLDKLTEVLKSKGVTIFARVDHAAGATKIGAKLAPTQLLIFGNPKLGTPLMRSNRQIGLALPMKALAWQDDKGDVWLSYRAPADLKKGFAIKDRDPLFNKMAGALGKFTDMAVK